ncbi:MAG: hypothetical protein Unbinned3138contig1001_33 [Prokaryotic dsDNA virus sp.]|nr:MAG: hypothetical protein Unbinned3138contig1001_33 [Prokaryotic dsDNA virus sp.]|tara:strand:+ start:30922 stop:31347 length:426 start_codon:yes stop_codon:yes gene_type:complete
MNKQDAINLIKDVAIKRGITINELCGCGRRGSRVSSARRAIAMIAQDKWGFKLNSNHCMGLNDLANLLGAARSSLHAGARRWKEAEGSQDSNAEQTYRDKGHFLPNDQEPFKDMVLRVQAKKMQDELPRLRRECVYWHSKE